MSNETAQKIGFGYVDPADESLKTRSGGTFGLNQGIMSKFEFNPNAGKDGTAANAIDIEFLVGDRDFRLRIYETTRVFDKKNNEITDVNSKEYIDAYNDDWKQKNAVIVHVLKAFRTEQEIKQALSVPMNTFADFGNIVQSLVPDGFNTRPLDIFLEFQWNINDGQDRTFLQLPRNMKGGYFIVPAQQGTWKEVRLEDGSLVYKNEAGVEHPFKRDKNYMESNKANQQIEGELPASGTSAPAGAPTGGNAQAGTW